MSNIDYIVQLNLTESELDAVIAHELGHIFNNPTKEIMKDKQDVEFYADFFVGKLKLQENLISGIEKYLKQPNSTNKDLFLKRINKLNNKELFIGKTQKLSLFND